MMQGKDVPLHWVDAAMTGASPGCRDDARFYLANAYDKIREDLLWSILEEDPQVTCACGRSWDVLVEQGPDHGHGRYRCESAADAVVKINGYEVRLHSWRLADLDEWGGSTDRWSFFGWIQGEFNPTQDIYNNPQLEAVFPGRTVPEAPLQHVEVKGYGDGRGLALKLVWGRRI